MHDMTHLRFPSIHPLIRSSKPLWPRRQQEETAAAAAAHATARLRLPPGTKPFVPYEDDFDREDAPLWMRTEARGPVWDGVG